MNKKEIENLVNSMVAKICIDLLDEFKDKDCFEIINDFSKSNTFANLWNFKTGLWKESPAYIIDQYLKETKN